LAICLLAGGTPVAFATAAAQEETATVEGSVFLQGHQLHGGASVTLGPLAATTDASGTFAFVNVGQGEHVLTIEAQGYLPATRTVEVESDGLIVVPQAALLGGELIGNSHVDVEDLLVVVEAFGSDTPTVDAPSADVSGDGDVNVLDLVLVGRNFGRSESEWRDPLKSVIVGDPITGYDDTMWPTVGTVLSSPFGPRQKASEDLRYDYHRGIDIPGVHGEPVVAFADGEVYRTYLEGQPGSSFTGGGTVVILRHETETPFPFHGGEHTRYFSLYLHLDSITVEEATSSPYAVVSKGDLIGTLGQTGGTTFDHVHFELRIGTTCSREAQQTGCSDYYASEAIDPHINPVGFITYGNQNSLQVEYLQTSPLRVRVTSDRDELDFNKIRVVSGAVEKVVDFNERAGIDPVDIDNPVYEGVTIEPARFSTSTETYSITLEFADLGGFDLIEAVDLWGNGVSLAWE